MVSESFTSSDADDALPPTAKRRRPTGTVCLALLPGVRPAAGMAVVVAMAVVATRATSTDAP